MQNKKMSAMTWPQIEKAFQENYLVVIPLGAACKEHGYHLPMNTDLIMAEKLADYVMSKYHQVLIAPPIIDSYFPVFIEYPGSLSLTLETATEVIVQRCQLWYQQGAKKFYVINNGISTNTPLKAAKMMLEKTCQDIQFHYLDLTPLHDDPRVVSIMEQKMGTHADEIETSMMMVVAPEVVQLEKAVPEESRNFSVSQSGAFGNPTLATKEKGEIGLAVLHEMIEKDLAVFKLERQ
ncbi:MAG: creatininase family protein [Proteobacteria bacterium]|nr:creatininase family protein [Pseudomonadota bacterium]